MPNWYNIKAAKNDKPSQVSLYDEIGGWGVPASKFIAEIAGLKDIDLTIHSPGGDVVDGLAIYNALLTHNGNVRVIVNTMAASMASLIALAGDEVEITDNGFLMIHNPWGLVVGEAVDFEKAANEMRKWEDILANHYVERTGIDEVEIREMMRAETWMHGQEAVEKGFANRVVKATKAAACAWKSDIADKFNNRPAALRQRSAINNHNEKTAMEDKDKMLEMQAKLNKLESELMAKNDECEALNKQIKVLDAEVTASAKDALQSAGKIVALGKAHNQLDMAVVAIGAGKSIDDFKSDLLDAYASGNQAHTPESATDPTDASVAPKNKEEFLATYRALSGTTKSEYYDNHSAILRK